MNSLPPCNAEKKNKAINFSFREHGGRLSCSAIYQSTINLRMHLSEFLYCDKRKFKRYKADKKEARYIALIPYSFIPSDMNFSNDFDALSELGNIFVTKNLLTWTTFKYALI